MSRREKPTPNPFFDSTESLKGAFESGQIDWYLLGEAATLFIEAGGNTVTFLQWAESEAHRYNYTWEQIQATVMDVVSKKQDRVRMKENIEKNLWTSVAQAILDTYEQLIPEIQQEKITRLEVLETIAFTVESIASDLNTKGVQKFLQESGKLDEPPTGN